MLHLEGLEDEGPAFLLVLLHHSGGAGNALPECLPHQAVLSKSMPKLTPATGKVRAGSQM